MKIQDLINKLEELKQEQGNVEVDVYLSFTKESRVIAESNVYYDDELGTVSIGVYG